MALAPANRYASALAEVLSQPAAATTPAAALTQLRAFAAAYAESADLRTALATPAVASSAKRKLLGEIAARLGLAKPTRNLLFVLSDHGRVGMVDEIVAALAAWIDSRTGVARIQVSSAAPLDDEQRARVIEKFRRLTGRAVAARFAVDEDLLGGTVVRLGSTVYDGSLRAQLQALDRAMAGAA